MKPQLVRWIRTRCPGAVPLVVVLALLVPVAGAHAFTAHGAPTAVEVEDRALAEPLQDAPPVDQEIDEPSTSEDDVAGQESSSHAGKITTVTSEDGLIISYTMEGNLESKNPLDCVGAEGVTPDHTPADIAVGMRKCYLAGESQKAAELTVFAYVYANFDMFRVTDRTAHQALIVLMRKAAADVPEELMEQYRIALSALAASERFRVVCDRLFSLPPPTYRPTYMIAHGLASFDPDSGDPLATDFDAAAAYRKVVEAARCVPEPAH